MRYHFPSIRLYLAQFCLIAGLLLLLPIGNAYAQLSCPGIAFSAPVSVHAEDLGPGPVDSCSSVLSATIAAFANGFEVKQGVTNSSVAVLARVNGVNVAPNLACSGNPTYSINGNGARVAEYGGAFGVPICQASYSDHFGETVQFQFSISQTVLFGVPIDWSLSNFTVSTGGFDNVAPTVSVGAATPVGPGTITVPITFNEDVTGLTPSGLVVTNGTVTSITGSGANYVATIALISSAPGSVSVSAAVVVDQGQNPNLASATTAFDNSGATSQIISRHLQARATALLQNQTRLTDFINSARAPSLAFSGAGDNSDGQVDGFAALSNPYTTYGVWARISGAWSEAEDVETQFFTGTFGAHAFVTPDLIIGAMAQFDSTESEGSTSDFEGFGWLFGPYLAAKLPDQPLFFEARVAYGQSDNTISPFGTYEDDFDTERFLVTASIEGVFAFGDGWSLNPTTRISYFTEEQDSYRDAVGNLVESQRISMGELEFGPTIRRAFAVEGGALQAELGVAGIWLFAQETGADGTLALLDEDELRAKLTAALRFTSHSGWDVGADMQLDGLGGSEDYSSAGGSLRVIRNF